MLGAVARMNPQQAALLGLSLLTQRPRLDPGFTYLNVGHSNLKPQVLARLRRRGMARFVALIHDVIPMDHPELCRVDQVAPARARLRHVAQQADAVIAVSKHAAQQIAAQCQTMGRVPQMTVAHPGVTLGPCACPDRLPYFVAIGTIEPRKNLSLLLDVWERFGADGPVLHLVGQRGWEDPAVLARLEALQGQGCKIIEHTGLGDDRVQALLGGARALLFPTLAEGFGIPLYEARGIGVPVIASDLAVLREDGSAQTQYLPTDDPHAWYDAICAACARRPVTPQPVPSWQAHFAKVAPALQPMRPLELAS